MSTCNELYREHRAAFSLAVLTALICVLPQIYFRIDHKEVYQEGVEAMEMLVSSNWSPRVREVQDGHPNWGSIYFKDGKDDPYLFQPLGSIIVAYTGKLLGLGINNTILLSRIIFPAIAFLLLYSFVFLISRNKAAALASTSLVLLIQSILSPSGIQTFIHEIVGKGVSPVNFLEISHPVNSMMIFVFFFGFMVPFWMFFQRKKWQWGVLSAVVLGLNFYNYFYSWTFLFSFGIVLACVLALRKEWMEVRRIVYVFLGGILVAVPYLWNLYSSTLHVNYAELASRHGVIVSHAPLFVGTTVAAAIVIFLLGFPREDKRKYIFGLALMFTPFVTLNQQIVTGKVLQVGHYHWYMHQPFAIIFVVITMFYLFERFCVGRYYIRLAAFSIVVISFAIGARIQMLSYASIDAEERGDGAQVTIERQKYAPVMHWLNGHAEKESVVFANEKTSNVVVIYTPLNVFHHHADHLTLPASDERLEDIMFTFYRLRGTNSENVEKIFHEERSILAIKLFGIFYREKSGGDEHIPDEVIGSLIERYRGTLNLSTSEWLFNIWKKYEVEYLVWDKKSDPDWKLDQYEYLEEVFAADDISVYRLISQ